MKRFFKTTFALCLAAGGSTLLAGCSLLVAPEPDPIMKEPEPPKPGVFVAADYNTAGIKINVANDPKLPEYFEFSRVDSGDLLWVRGVEITQTGTPPKEQKSYGAPDIVRLAGISVPQPGQPGAQDSIRTLRQWTANRKLSIEQDGRYPVDLQGRRRVQIFFPGGKGGTQSLNLNRMMVRSGFAVVDVFEPTIFDVKGWFNDEEYARTNRLGLWKLGIVIDNRQLPPSKITTTTTTTTKIPGSVTTQTTTATSGASTPPATAPAAPAPKTTP